MNRHGWYGRNRHSRNQQNKQSKSSPANLSKKMPARTSRMNWFIVVKKIPKDVCIHRCQVRLQDIKIPDQMNIKQSHGCTPGKWRGLEVNFACFSDFHKERKTNLLGHVLRACEDDPLRVSLQPNIAYRVGNFETRVRKLCQSWIHKSKH